MNFQQKIEQMKIKMFDLISTKEITYLKDLDRRININKKGKFEYHKFNELNTYNIWIFLYELEENNIYTLIPFISKNDRPDEPYIILSQQFLITNNSKASLNLISTDLNLNTILKSSKLPILLLISEFINNKIGNYQQLISWHLIQVPKG